jgi:hypothetical protein
MKLIHFLAITLFSVAFLERLNTPATAAVFAKQDFDGGAMNLVSGFDPVTGNLDGGAGDFVGVGNLAAWPQGYPPGAPFGFVDDSIVSLSNPANAPFATDSEAVYGQAATLENDFFGISDTREFTPAPSASWTFNVAGASNLMLSIDMGAQANDQVGGFPTDSLIEFKYQFDGGPAATAFSIAPDPNVSGTYIFRPMDSTFTPFTGANGPLVASGPNPVTKIAVDTGAAADNQVLDKSPPEGTGAGRLDTFRTSLTGTGNQLTLTMTANLAFEAMVFDNIVIEGDGSVVVGVPGDYNNNRAVDAADYVLWRDGGPLMNEGNNPGTVDQADYEFWRARFGSSTAAGLGSAQVPEPTSVTIAWCAMVFILAARRWAQVRAV